MGTIQELATKEAGLRSKIEVLSPDLGETRELIAEKRWNETFEAQPHAFCRYPRPESPRCTDG